MKFMLLVKATADSEAGVLPSEELLAGMGQFNEAMVDAGVLRAGEGLHPSTKGARVRFADGESTITDGPFRETQSLISGFWIIEVDSRAEALEWAKRIPFRDGEVEVRRVFATEDFAPSDPTGDLRAAEEQLRARISGASA